MGRSRVKLGRSLAYSRAEAGERAPQLVSGHWKRHIRPRGTCHYFIALVQCEPGLVSRRVSPGYL